MAFRSRSFHWRPRRCDCRHPVFGGSARRARPGELLYAETVRPLSPGRRIACGWSPASSPAAVWQRFKLDYARKNWPKHSWLSSGCLVRAMSSAGKARCHLKLTLSAVRHLPAEGRLVLSHRDGIGSVTSRAKRDLP